MICAIPKNRNHGYLKIKIRGDKMYMNKTDFKELCEHIDFLLTHNKNYNKKQWYALIEADEILKAYKFKEYGAYVIK